jgi:hypothetical protein
MRRGGDRRGVAEQRDLATGSSSEVSAVRDNARQVEFKAESAGFEE